MKRFIKKEVVIKVDISDFFQLRSIIWDHNESLINNNYQLLSRFDFEKSKFKYSAWFKSLENDGITIGIYLLIIYKPLIKYNELIS